MESFIQCSFPAILTAVFALAPVSSAWTNTATTNGVAYTYTVTNGLATIGLGGSAPAITNTTAGVLEIPSTLGGFPVTAIGPSAFLNCSRLTSVTVPNGVTVIGDTAFSDCSELRSVIWRGNAPAFGSGVYSGTPEDLTNFVASGTTGWDGRPGSTVLPAAWPVGDDDARPLDIRVPAGSVRIFFDGNGGDSVTWAAVKSQALGTLPVSVDGPGTFVGWYSAKSGGTKVTSTMTAPTTAKTYYAHWTAIATATALDCTGQTFTTGGDVGWYAQTAEAKVGASAMRSGRIADGQSSWLQTKVTGSCLLRFWWKVSSEDADTLSCTVDDTDVDTSPIGGTDGDWAWVEYEIDGDDAHTVRWTYTKDDATSAGSDCARLDGVEVAVQGSAEVGGITWQYLVIGSQTELYGGELTACIDAATAGVLTIPSTLGGHTVTSIGAYAFTSCKGLTSVTIPAGVKTIGESAFSGCSGLTNVVGGTGVATIGKEAFSGCSSLKTITLPAGVTSIGDLAFGGCRFGAISVASGNTSYAVSNQVLYAAGFTRAVASASGALAGTLELPATVTDIAPLAFAYCTNLTAVMVPAGVARIGSGAFSHCSSLTNVTYRGNAPVLYGANDDGLGFAYDDVSSPDAISTPDDLTSWVTAASLGWDGTADSASKPATWMQRPLAVIGGLSVAVDRAWLDKYNLVTDGDYAAAATNVCANGLQAWESYVADLIPTNPASQFLAHITYSNGVAAITWTPDEPGRVYTVQGRASLTAGDWAATNAASRFFRVKVSMP